MDIKLGPVERRVLGVLIEKALALPQYYPMTVNAVVTGCNQKQNRDPVMDVDEEAVWDALETLRAQNVALRIAAGPGGRADKWKHNVTETLGWQTPQRAVMAELLLRGPQTVGELRGRAARLTSLDSADSVTEILNALAAAPTPFVKSGSRQPGQSAIRWTHLLYPPGEQVAASPHVAPVTDRPSQSEGPRREIPSASDRSIASELLDLREQVAELQRELRELQDQMRTLTG